MKLIKRLFISSSLVLGANSFCFWSMHFERGGCDKIPTIPLPKDDSINFNDSIKSWDVQDDHTLNRLIIWNYYSIDGVKEVNENLLPFLKGEFKYDANYWDILTNISAHKYNKIYRQGPEKPGQFLIENGVLSPNILATTETEQDLYHIFKKNFSITPIDFKQCFNSLSGIKVNNLTTDNEQKVMLSKKYKSIDLKTALLKHFEKPSISEELPYYIAQSKKEYYGSNIEPILIRMHNLSKDPVNLECDLDLLKESDILAVWCLIPQEVELKDSITGQDKIKDGNPETRIVERQMIGLARDKDGKLYHWTTHLGKDIACLMQYANPIK